MKETKVKGQGRMHLPGTFGKGLVWDSMVVFNKALRRLSRSLSKLKLASVTYKPATPRKPEGWWAHVLNTNAGKESVPPTETGKPTHRRNLPQRHGDLHVNTTCMANTLTALQQNWD